TMSPKSFWGEFVFNKHGCRWRAEMWRFESVLEDIDRTFILKEGQRNAIKAFVDRKYVFAVLPTGSGKSLMHQLAQMVYVMVILRYSDWLWVYPIERRCIFFPCSVETRPIITAQRSGIRLIFALVTHPFEAYTHTHTHTHRAEQLH